MNKENKLKIEWIQIILTAIITGLVSLIVAIIVFNYTNEKVELNYVEFPISSYQSDSTKISIVNYSIKNNGLKTATGIQFLIQLPNGAKIKEPNIKLSNSLTRYEILHKDEATVVYELDNLYKNENANVSLLVENLQKNTVEKVELRCNENIGGLLDESKKTASPTLIYICLILLVVFIILLVVVIFGIKSTAKSFKLLKKHLNEQSDIEEQKVRDIITQGVEYCDMGMIDDSIRVLIKGKYLHPESSSIHSNLARAYSRKGDFKKAESEFNVAEKIMQDDSDKLIFHYTKAHYYALKNEKESMLKHLKAAHGFDKDRVCEKMCLDDEFDNFQNDIDFLNLKTEKTNA